MSPPAPARRARRHRRRPPDHAMIRITERISIEERELEERFVRASGPGGQNVNKLSSAVQLRFDVRGSPSLAADVRLRLERLAGRRLTRDGVLVIMAQRHRTQERNRQDALDRLIELIQRASVAPTPRRPTRPTRGSKERRLASKKNRSGIKSLRQEKPENSE
jgi:ribosome-associated protein